MKKSTLYAAMAIFAAGLLASCSSDPEYDDTEYIQVSDAQYPYDKEGVWLDNDKSVNLNIEDYIFSHSVDEWGYVYGFTPSKVSDTSAHSPLSSFPYASAFGGGLKGNGSQYLVGYWAEFLEGNNCEFYQRTCRIYEEDGDQFEPQSVMVTNNTYLKYAALNGTDFSPKFEPGDYVMLIAHGVHMDGTESQSTFYLVNIESSDIEAGILQGWEKFDLSGMGACTGIYFTMAASERLTGDYGLNIPTYFCLDQLIVKE